MNAISFKDEYASIILDRCIGCGLCIPKCPKNAIKLKKKDKIKKPPRGHFRLMLSISRKKNGNIAALKLLLKTIFSFKLYYIIKKK